MNTRQKILIIDDEAVIRNVLKSSLKKEGYEAWTAANGTEGLEMAAEILPDIILLDINMPDINGYEVLERLLADKETSDIPVIFLTARADKAEQVRGLEAGAVDYITKPFYLKEVLARIRIHLRLKEYQEILARKNQELEEFFDLLLELNAKLEEIARKDEIMQIWNRRAFNEQINNTHNFSVRYMRPYSIIIVDLDHFKNYNDLYGHQKGDQVLQAVAQTISNSCRITDFVARYGGEEIVVLLPETEAKSSLVIAERIISSIRDLNIEHADNENLGIVTASVGVSSFLPDKNKAESWEDVLKKADEALYRAKNTGRNRVCQKI